MNWNWVWVYGACGVLYAMAYGCVHLCGLREVLFVVVAWPMDLVRVVIRGAIDWWRS